MAAVDPTAGTRTLRVFRYKQGDLESRFDEFRVPARPRTTVLEALRHVRLRIDRTLAIRHSCFHASCGTCGMRVNGREVLACVTPLADVENGPVTVEPIANVPVVADLVVDMRAFFARFGEAVLPLVRSSEALPEAEAPEGVEGYGRFEDCIECGLCLSACPIAATDPLYLGPAAIAAAQRIEEEARGRDVEAALAWVDEEHGLWRCHVTFECTEACPSNVRPGHRIMALRGARSRQRFRRLAGGAAYGTAERIEEESLGHA